MHKPAQRIQLPITLKKTPVVSTNKGNQCLAHVSTYQHMLLILDVQVRLLTWSTSSGILPVTPRPVSKSFGSPGIFGAKKKEGAMPCKSEQKSLRQKQDREKRGERREREYVVCPWVCVRVCVRVCVCACMRARFARNATCTTMQSHFGCRRMKISERGKYVFHSKSRTGKEAPWDTP